MVKCSLCEGNHDLDDFYSLIYRKGVSVCFVTNCVLVVLVHVFSIIMPQIVRTERNTKFINNKRNPISLHGYKAEKSTVKQPDSNSSDE